MSAKARSRSWPHFTAFLVGFILLASPGAPALTPPSTGLAYETGSGFVLIRQGRALEKLAAVEPGPGDLLQTGNGLAELRGPGWSLALSEHSIALLGPGTGAEPDLELVYGRFLLRVSAAGRELGLKAGSLYFRLDPGEYGFDYVVQGGESQAPRAEVPAPEGGGIASRLVPDSLAAYAFSGTALASTNPQPRLPAATALGPGKLLLVDTKETAPGLPKPQALDPVRKAFWSERRDRAAALPARSLPLAAAAAQPRGAAASLDTLKYAVAASDLRLKDGAVVGGIAFSLVGLGLQLYGRYASAEDEALGGLIQTSGALVSAAAIPLLAFALVVNPLKASPR